MPAPRFALVVLNDLMFRVKIEAAAKQAGYEVRFITMAAELDAAVQGRHPDLIILDLNYQTARPLAIIEHLKSEADTAAIPLLAYVSHVQVDLKEEALKLGCDRVIARSVVADKLPQVLADFGNTLES